MMSTDGNLRPAYRSMSLLILTLILIAGVVVGGVGAASPSSNYSQNISWGTVPLPVSFTDTSTGSPTAWNWFFGDETYTQPWTVLNSSPGWSGRRDFAAVVTKTGNIVILGGRITGGSRANDVWRSLDNGLTWAQINASAGWGIRQGHAAVVTGDGDIIMTAGTPNGQNDTWISHDEGFTWGLQNSSGFPARVDHTMAVIGNTVFVIGGSTGDSNQSVYASDDDGLTWYVATPSQGYALRSGTQAIKQRDDELIIAAGLQFGGTYTTSLVSSTDGITWSFVNSSGSPFAGRTKHSFVALPDGGLIVSGGWNGATYYNDTWASRDGGNTWSELNSSSGYTPRYGQSTVVTKNNKILLLGGASSSTTYISDVWSLDLSSSTLQNPTHTYGAPRFNTVSLTTSNADGYNTAYEEVGVVATDGQTIYIHADGDSITAADHPTGSVTDDLTADGNLNYLYQMKSRRGLTVNVSHNMDGSGKGSQWGIENQPYHINASMKYVIHFFGNNDNRNGNSLNGNQTADNLITMAEWDIARNLTPILVAHPLESSNDTANVSMITARLVNRGYTPINMWDALDTIPGDGILQGYNGTYYCSDGIHPNATGQRLMADYLWTHYDFGIGVTAQFTPTGPVSVWYPNSTQFTDTSTGSPTAWEWTARNVTGNNVTFSFSTSQNPTFAPPTSGNFSISLNASTSTAFNISTQITFVNVSQAAFTANATTAYQYPMPVQFTDISTGVPTNWSWTFGDTYTSTQQNPLHIYTVAGNYTVRLTVWNATSGFSTSAITYINMTYATQSVVSQFLPLASSGIWYPLDHVAFTDNTTGSPNEWNWTYQVDGVGTRIPFNTTQNATFFPTSIGNFLISLNASTAIYSNISTQNTWVNATWPPTPIIEFSANTTTPNILSTVQFTDSSYYPNAWLWDFGDGTTSTLQNPSHVYTSLGLKTVTLTGYISENVSITNTSSKVGYINVLSVAGIPNANFVGTPLVTNIGSPVSFTDTSTGSPTSWTWNFGDSSGSALQNPSHAYSSLGLYTVNLTVSNLNGTTTLSRASYINVTNTTLSGFNPVDIIMDPSYVLTLHVTDSDTGAAIPDATLLDSNGDTFTTTNGTFYLSYGYGAVVLYLTSTGYVSKSVSYIIDSDQTQTVQLVASTTSNQNTWYSPHQVRFRILDSYGAPIKSLNVNATAVANTLPSVGDLQYMYGINPIAADEMVNNTLIMGGTTGNDGAIVFTMLGSIGYDIKMNNPVRGGLFTTYVMPIDSQYNIWVNTSTLVGTNPADSVYLALQNTTLWFAEPNVSYIRLGVNYTDSSGKTSDVTWYIKNGNNNTVVYTQDLGNPGTGTLSAYRDIRNLRGYTWVWNYTAVRTE